MAVKTFYILTTTATAPNWFGSLQDSGAAPAAAASAYGWIPGTGLLNAPYWQAGLGATAGAQVQSTVSNIDSRSGPKKGTGSAPSSAGDSWISPTPYTGQFPAGNWTFSFAMRTTTVRVDGFLRCRVWASVNADGTSARALTGSTLIGSTISAIATATTYTSSVTWAAPLITLTNEYLFFEVEWQETVVGTAQFSNILFYQSAAAVTTTNYVAWAPLQGDMAPSVVFAGDLSVDRPMAGDLAPSVAFGATALGADYVLAGDLAPSIVFGGALGYDFGLAFDLAPAVTFWADLGVSKDMEGDLAPQVALGGLLGLDFAFQGDLGLQVDFACLGLIAGPLWAVSELCPPSDWDPSEPCPPPAWAASEICPPSAWNPSELCPPPLWAESEPCLPPLYVESRA